MSNLGIDFEAAPAPRGFAQNLQFSGLFLSGNRNFNDRRTNCKSPPASFHRKTLKAALNVDNPSFSVCYGPRLSPGRRNKLILQLPPEIIIM